MVLETELRQEGNVDGSSIVKGAKAGIMLINPEGARFKHAIELDFVTTNNATKYKAFLARLSLAAEVGAKRLLIHTDSQLVVDQVSQNFEARHVVMA